MEGFWTVKFTGVQGFGAGVVTLIAGQLFGGDSNFLYKGTYTQSGNTLNATVQVKRAFPGAPSVMGRDQFELQLTGTLQGNAVTCTGGIPGTPLQFQAQLTRQGELPR